MVSLLKKVFSNKLFLP